MVGKISGVYRATTANAPEIPNFPIMLNVILAGIRDVSPAEKIKNTSIYRSQNICVVSVSPTTSIMSSLVSPHRYWADISRD